MIKKQYNPYGSTKNDPKMIVVHAMGEYILTENGIDYEYASDFLINLKLSAHVLVTPDGNIIRCRSDDIGAYHAKGFNTDSLGIEVMVAGKHDYGSFISEIKKDYVTKEQYESLVKQCREWKQLHGITKIVRHSDISPGRKLDPGTGFPWDKFLKEIS